MTIRFPESGAKRTLADSATMTLPSALTSIEKCADGSVAIPTCLHCAAVTKRPQAPSRGAGSFAALRAEPLPTEPAKTTSATAVAVTRARGPAKDSLL
jgi:hypothetical protein